MPWKRDLITCADSASSVASYGASVGRRQPDNSGCAHHMPTLGNVGPGPGGRARLSVPTCHWSLASPCWPRMKRSCSSVDVISISRCLTQVQGRVLNYWIDQVQTAARPDRNLSETHGSFSEKPGAGLRWPKSWACRFQELSWQICYGRESRGSKIRRIGDAVTPRSALRRISPGPRL